MNYRLFLGMSAAAGIMSTAPAPATVAARTIARGDSRATPFEPADTARLAVRQQSTNPARSRKRAASKSEPFTFTRAQIWSIEAVHAYRSCVDSGVKALPGNVDSAAGAIQISRSCTDARETAAARWPALTKEFSVQGEMRGGTANSPSADLLAHPDAASIQRAIHAARADAASAGR